MILLYDVMFSIMELCHFVANNVARPVRTKNDISYKISNYSHKNTLDQLLYCLRDDVDDVDCKRDEFNRDVIEYANEDLKEELIKSNKRFFQAVKSNKYTNEMIMQLCQIMNANIFILTNNLILKIFYVEGELYLDKKNITIAINTEHSTSDTYIQKMGDVDLTALISDKMVFVMGDKKLRYATEAYKGVEKDELVDLYDSLWF